ncbi:hypothetical protein ISN45_At02g000550 [Arabidopsis thaliana x Arabidopsis arenosa]|uniref:Uncharacterized protein n=1 Tax=Arabidopsis thaliana x Arabidopsis arenosa TaxID=1240361 RepID=A0A8T2FGR8_9BRAS|nr:hypothetical protein ISN45_At02g000550 [Arabidopsis thaliana x Arabidopsis arenosa]
MERRFWCLEWKQLRSPENICFPIAQPQGRAFSFVVSPPHLLSNLASPKKAGTTVASASTLELLNTEVLVRFVSLSKKMKLFFRLYCPYCASEAFDPWGKISSTGSRNFVLSNKLETQNLEDSMMTTTTRKTSGRWKAWLNKSFGLMVPSH